LAGCRSGELAENRHVHRRTVRQALASAVPPPRKAYARRTRPAIDAYVEVIDSWLLARPGRAVQAAAHGAAGLAAAGRRARRDVRGGDGIARRGAPPVELGLDRVQVAVPQTHPPGAEAKADFGEFADDVPVAPDRPAAGWPGESHF
jgi:hypothetical protein